jgi:uncharacterized membrane protein (DUF2068 family)
MVRRPWWPMRAFSGLRTVAVFEAAKGALVLLAGFGLFDLFHRDAQHAAEQLVRQFHLNPASHYPRIFLHLAGQATPPRLLMLAAGALAYAAARLVEAYGLWRGRTWAKWFALVNTGIYLPLEVWDLGKGLTWPRVLLFTVNLGIVACVARTLQNHERELNSAAKERKERTTRQLRIGTDSADSRGLKTDR